MNVKCIICGKETNVNGAYRQGWIKCHECTENRKTLKQLLEITLAGNTANDDIRN